MWIRNVKLAFRALFKAPFVTSVAIISLALGIGANAAIFSLFDQMLLRSLPVSEPGRLVNLVAEGPKHGMTSCNNAGSCEAVFSYPMFRDLERAETGLSGIAAHRLFGANLAYEGQTVSGEGMLVSGSYFAVLGVRAALGRLIGPTDDETIGGHPVAVLSHGFWQGNLGGNPNVLNETIIVNGRSLTIIGVAPAGFNGTTLGGQPHVFVPFSMAAAMSPMFDQFENRRAYWVYLFGRLNPGVSIERARTRINAVYRPILADVEAPLQEGMSEQTMTRFLAREIEIAEGRRGQSSVHGDVRMPMILLLASTGIVLLIACANIANLLLARGADRSMEMAVRLSLGANRPRILAQLLSESLLLALLGGAASLVIASWTHALIVSILPPEAGSMLQAPLRLSVLVFAAALAIATGLLFGLVPALESTRPDLVSTIRAHGRNIQGARKAARLRSALVTGQIALSMALLISAGLFLKSLLNVSRVDLGLRIDNVVMFAISPELNGYEPARSKVLFARLEEELAAIPGVSDVSSALVPLLSGSNWGTDVGVEGFERGPDIDSNSRFNEIGPGYFRTLGIPLIRGREFTPSDDAGSLKVAIVNEAFAAKFNLGRGAVGKWMTQGRSDSLDIQIVGLVQNAKYSEVKDDVPPLFFVPYRQDERIGAINFYVRTAVPPSQVLRNIPAVVAKLDPNLPVEDLKTMPQQVRENVFLDRMTSTLSAAFAALATLLAAVGLYGVLAYTVAQRTREIGVRMALGADAGRVRRMVLRQVLRVLAIGGVIGIGGALALGRAARSLLFGLEAHDPVVVAVAAGVLALIALAAGYIPAYRASRVHPMDALRYE